MSWQQYVDDSLISTGKVSQAAIFSLDGTELGTSPSFKVSSTEAKDIIAGFDNNKVLYDSGVFVAGNKYYVLRINDSLITGREPTGSGVCIAKTNQVILIGVYKKGMEGGQCTNTIETLGEFLSGMKY
ncbi:hypothetical protein INT45_007555 [Circinella minor]|uniref:Profilin n=1 Tax=Circinella minor TaxID=1195481 RepID=A0A8H7S207_9FUNG|nr:hypothetical protein INT45_007555 [Circinella minor]